MNRWLIETYYKLYTKLHLLGMAVLVEVFLALDVSLFLAFPQLLIMFAMIALYRKFGEAMLEKAYEWAGKYRSLFYIMLFLIASNYAFYTGINLDIF